MISDPSAPLLFAAHLLAFLVALAAALVLAREHDRTAFARGAGALGFLALAAAEAYHGAGFGADTGALIGWVRTAGYALIFLGALPPVRPAGVPVVVGDPRRPVAGRRAGGPRRRLGGGLPL